MKPPPRFRRLLAAFTLLVLATPSSVAVAASADGPPSSASASGFDFGVHPYADPGTAPRSAFVFDVGAGQTIADRVALVNPSDAPKDFYVYCADAYTTEVGGGFAVHLRTEQPKDAGAWITLPVSRYTVAPRTSALLPIQLTVPDDATPGDHSAGIVAEEVAPTAAPSKGAGVVPVHRVASRVYVRVKGEVHPGLTVADLAVDRRAPTVPFASHGSATVTFTVHNTGNVRARLQDVDVTLTGVLGRRLHRQRLERATDTNPASPLPDQILPGGTVRFVQHFDGVPFAGPVTAAVSVGASDPVGATPIRTSRTVSFWIVPWIVLAVLLLPVVAFALRRWRRRRRIVPAVPIADALGGAGRT